jgi:hypothetical protein
VLRLFLGSPYYSQSRRIHEKIAGDMEFSRNSMKTGAEGYYDR